MELFRRASFPQGLRVVRSSRDMMQHNLRRGGPSRLTAQADFDSTFDCDAGVLLEGAKLKPNQCGAKFALGAGDQKMDSSKWAILLPLTSRGPGGVPQLKERLNRFFVSLKETTSSVRPSLSKAYLGIDEDDLPLRMALEQEKESVLVSCPFAHAVFIFNYPPGSICRIWRQLAHEAYLDGMEFFICLGDDVELKTPNWMEAVEAEFDRISSDRGVPPGFGCVALEDLTFPGFPTFPVVSKVHIKANEGEIFSPRFINQDADPFLFQLYRRFGASSFLARVNVTNSLGGANPARYDKKSNPQWTGHELEAATNRLTSFLGGVDKRLVTLDIGVPSYRVDLEALHHIFALVLEPDSGQYGKGVPEGLDVSLILVVDDPASPAIEGLKRRFEWSHRVKIRVNLSNLGASMTRNRILDESASDWVLFLDDDVKPNADILEGCLTALKSYTVSNKTQKEVVGFVGCTSFPPPCGIFTSAVLLSGCAFFWDAAEVFAKPGDEMPWGITANLLVKRGNDGVQFDPAFPRTGGGEDIDFVLRKCFYSSRTSAFVAAPGIRALHPWWFQGAVNFSRFWGWAYGDSLLLTRYKQFTYIDVAPNGAELAAVAMLVLFTLAFVSLLELLATAVASAACALQPGPLQTSGTHLTTSPGLPRVVTAETLRDFCILVLPCVITADMLHDFLRYHVLEPTAHLDTVGPRGSYRRAAACAVSALIRLTSEFGRLWGPLSRGDFPVVKGFHKMFMKRFDWFTGLHPPAIVHERAMRLQRFSLFLCLYLTALYYRAARYKHCR